MGDCTVDRTGFVDVDADGIEDLLVQHGSTLTTWPSTHIDAPWSWTFPDAPFTLPVVLFQAISATEARGVQVMWHDATFTEYLIDPGAGSLEVRWEELDVNTSRYFVGDLDALGLPDSGLGRQVATIAGQDVLLATILDEGASSCLFYGADFGPGNLGLITDFGTPEASLVQVVPVDQTNPDDYMPELVATVGNDIVFGEPTRMVWFTFDPVAERITPTPEVWEPKFRSLPRQAPLGQQTRGREAQALAYVAHRFTGETDVLVWNRHPEALGPSPTGTTVNGCTWWATEFLEVWEVPPTTTTSTDGPADSSDTGQEATIPPPVPDPPWCGCTTSGAPSAALALVLTVASLRRARRATGST